MQISLLTDEQSSSFLFILWAIFKTPCHCIWFGHDISQWFPKDPLALKNTENWLNTIWVKLWKGLCLFSNRIKKYLCIDGNIHKKMSGGDPDTFVKVSFTAAVSQYQQVHPLLWLRLKPLWSHSSRVICDSHRDTRFMAAFFHLCP